MFAILKTLMSGLFGKSATLLYPLTPRKQTVTTRGHIENDIDSCIFCGICQRKCPTEALGVNREEKTWAIERFRCIQCNRCVEFCPKHCLSMHGEPSPVSTVMTKEVIHARIPSDASDHTDG